MYLTKTKCLLLICSLISLSSCKPDVIEIPDGLDAQEEALLIAVNDFRAEGDNCGSGFNQTAPSVTWNFVLEEIARVHAQDMDDNDFFAHEGSDGSTVGLRAAELDYAFSTIGENIATGFTAVDAVMEGWINSSSHCELLLNDNFTEIGVARVNNVWVMVLAKPL